MSQLIANISSYIIDRINANIPLPDPAIVDYKMMGELTYAVSPDVLKLGALQTFEGGTEIRGTVFGMNILYTRKYMGWPCMCGVVWEKHNQCKYLFYTPIDNLKYLEEKYESKRA